MGSGTAPLSARPVAVDATLDLLRRVWKQSADDNVLFLAGGLAFNVLLALVPFVLLLIAGAAALLGSQPEEAAAAVVELVQGLLPTNSPAASELLHGMVHDVLRTKGAVGVYAAVGFAWFSTRLFGSLRSCLALVFDGSDRGIVAGKLFDLFATLVATGAMVVYLALSTYLGLATSRGLALLQRLGLREAAMSRLAVFGGRAVALSLILGVFYALFRALPMRRPARRTAAIAAAASTILFELARNGFTLVLRQVAPTSLYTGTIAVIVAVVFWTYYGALLFLIGGELAQAYELRRAELLRLSST